MAQLTLYKDNYIDFTVISNLFIDKYMGDANDAQLKVYLYLIRMLSAGKSTSISDIADKFNHTEKDVMRSLRYWEKQGVLSLEYDQAKNLVGIRVNHLDKDDMETVPEQPRQITLSAESIKMPFQMASFQAENPVIRTDVPVTRSAISASGLDLSLPECANITITPNPFAKPVFSAEQLKEFKNRENVRQLFIIAEKYFARPLTASEMQSLLFFSDTLHFSDELIVTLLEYCIDRGKKDFKYIEKVAIGWAEEGITTPTEAQNSSGKYSKNVYVIMNELGKNGTPTSKEMEFINRWIKEYAFPMEIILDACQRTVLATDRHRFEYCDSILSSWKKDGVIAKSDIAKMDELHQKKKSTPKQAGKTASAGKFNQFDQNDYDFDALAQKLISN